MMKIAVLGATGFVGGHVLRVLRDQCVPTRAVVRNLAYAEQDADARAADACDVYELRHAFAGCTHVVHAALGDDEVISGSLAPVYTAAQAVGVKRLIYISTGSVHGQSPPPGTDENSPLTIFQPMSYNTAKVRAERSLRRLRRRGTVELVILRPTIVIGPGSRWVFDFADALREHRAYVVDGARGICNSIYVDNLAHAVTLACTAPNVDGEAFLINDEETVTWADLYRPIATALGHDFDAVPSLPPPTSVRPGLKACYVDPVRSSRSGRALLNRVPAPVKAAIRRAARVTRDSGAVQGVSSHATASGANISSEIAALHCCHWRLPHRKARERLGYVAPVPFDEACRRSVAWLVQRAAAMRATRRDVEVSV